MVLAMDKNLISACMVGRKGRYDTSEAYLRQLVVEAV
jgi:uncharacterized protein YbbK (DUF523 family)